MFLNKFYHAFLHIEHEIIEIYLPLKLYSIWLSSKSLDRKDNQLQYFAQPLGDSGLITLQKGMSVICISTLSSFSICFAEPQKIHTQIHFSTFIPFSCDHSSSTFRHLHNSRHSLRLKKLSTVSVSQSFTSRISIRG